MLRTRLYPTDISVTAAGMSRLSRISPTEACQAGSFKAKPQPARKPSPSTSQGSTNPRPPKIISVVDANAIKQCPANITHRRLKLSAMAPARIERKNTGNVDAA